MDNFRSCFLIFAFSHLLFLRSVVNAKIDSFIIDLIHRDSKFSPFYNKSATYGELFRDNALRSLSRINQFHQSSIDGEKIESSVIPSGREYFMKISIGTPPIERYALADTGSDLVWFQCEPCVQCFQQNSPLFNPTASSTYANLACDTSPCQDLPESGHGCGTSNECRYRYAYGGGSVTIGNLATETLTFDSTDGETPSFPNSIFGCGHQFGGPYPSRAGSGLVGLGAGPLSLITQLGDDIQHTFSYCLVPMTADSNSKLRFGKDVSISSGNGAVSTPLLSRGSEATFYYLNLEGASVGGTRVVNNEMDPSQGNIIIDSGTALTLLQPQFYNDLEAAIIQATDGLNPVQDPRGTYSLCYYEVPDTEIVFHFTEADVNLKTENLFLQLGDNLVCMAIVPSKSNTIIYGNVAQINFQVEYDIGNKLVSFAPADCSQF